MARGRVARRLGVGVGGTVIALDRSGVSGRPKATGGTGLPIAGAVRRATGVTALNRTGEIDRRVKVVRMGPGAIGRRNVIFVIGRQATEAIDRRRTGAIARKRTSVIDHKETGGLARKASGKIAQRASGKIARRVGGALPRHETTIAAQTRRASHGERSQELVHGLKARSRSAAASRAARDARRVVHVGRASGATTSSP